MNLGSGSSLSATYLTANTSLTFGSAALNMTGTQSATNTLIFQNSTGLSGAPTTPGNGLISPMGIYFGSDSVDTTTNGNGYMIGFSVEDAPSAGFTGGRIGLQGYEAVVGTPTTLSAAGIIGIQGATRISANMTGATGIYTNYKGYVFGSNSQVMLQSGATFLSGAVGDELDSSVASGASVADHFGLSIVETSAHANRGVYDDTAISINSQDSVTVGWKYGISFGAYAHNTAFNTDSTFITSQTRVVGPAALNVALNGVDFSATTFQTNGCAFKSTGFCIDPTGNATANSVIMPKITPTAAAPGAGKLQMEVVAGTNAGSCKIIAYAGTSTTAVTIIDNVGTGC